MKLSKSADIPAYLCILSGNLMEVEYTPFPENDIEEDIASSTLAQVSPVAIGKRKEVPG